MNRKKYHIHVGEIPITKSALFKYRTVRFFIEQTKTLFIIKP